MSPTDCNRQRFRQTIAVALPALLWLGGAFAQDQQLAEGAEAEPDIRPSVRYLEPAVPYTPETDFALPAPELPQELELGPEFEERMRNIRRFNESIVDAETISGAWDTSLIEQLSSLGSLQQQQGDYLAALETHERAVHVQRINGGLHTVDQVPLIEGMIDSYIAMGDWEQVDIYQKYLFYIQQKFYGNNDPRLITAIADLADWHIHAFTIQQGESLAVRLSSAQMLFNAAARMVDVHFGQSDPRYVEYLRGMARSAYLVAKNQDLLRELARAQFRVPQELLRDMLYWSYPIVPSGYRAGEEALLSILEFYRGEEGAAEQLAEATAQLADWYLLFNRRGQARNTYQEAWSVLDSEENAGESRQRLFGQVREIPVYAFDNREWLIENLGFMEDREEVNYDFIDVQVDVTAWGAVRNIETVSEQSSPTSSQHNWIRRSIRDSLFRPALVNGAMVRSDGNHFRYRYWY